MRILYSCDALTSSVDHGDGPTATRAVLAGMEWRVALGGDAPSEDPAKFPAFGAVRKV